MNLLHPLRSEEHTSELQSQSNLVCRLLLEKKKQAFCLDGAVALNGPSAARASVRLCASVDAEPRSAPRPCARRPPGAAISVFFNDRRPPEISTLRLHDALPT